MAGIILVSPGAWDETQIDAESTVEQSPLWDPPAGDYEGEWPTLQEVDSSLASPAGGYFPDSRADVFARNVVNDLVVRFPPQSAASLSDDPECSASIDHASLLVDPMQALQDGDLEANVEALSALQFQLQCLDESSVRVLDAALGVILHRAFELPEDQGDALVAGMWNSALLVADQLMHTGHSWVVSSAEENRDLLRASLERSAWQTVWSFNRRTDRMVRLPPHMCTGSTCAGTATSMLDALGDPRRLGAGFCGLGSLAANGMRCSQSVECAPGEDEMRLEGAAAFAQKLLGPDVFAPDVNVLAGFVPNPRSLSPNGLPLSPDLSRFGHAIGGERDVLCQGGASRPGQAGSVPPPFAGTFECLLQQNHEREAALGCEMGAEAVGFQSVSVHSVRDPGCALGGDGEPAAAPAEPPPARTTPEELTPAQKAALNTAVKSANDKLEAERTNPSRVKELTGIVNSVIAFMNNDTTAYPEAGSIPLVTEDQVRDALALGQAAPVTEIIPGSGKTLGEAAAGKIAISEEVLTGSPADRTRAHDTMLEEKYHLVLDALGVPGGPNAGEYHHTIMHVWGLSMDTTSGAHDSLEPGTGGECSSAAEKAINEAIECQLRAAEEALTLAGLGQPELIAPWEDPRTQNWHPDSAPVDAVDCLDLGGGQLPEVDPACARMLCADEVGCECAGAEPGSAAALPNLGGRNCMLTLCGMEQDVDPITCECRGFEEPAPGTGFGPSGPVDGGWPTWP